MPAPAHRDGAGALKRSLFPASAWVFACAALARPSVAATPGDAHVLAQTVAPPDSAAPAIHGPLTLERALRLALEHHPNLTERTWATRAEVARARDEARAPNPTLEASYENFGGSMPPVLGEKTLSLAQPLDFLGRRRGLRDVAKALDREGTATIEATRREILRQTAVAFLDSWQLEQRVDLLQRAEANSQAAIDAARERTRIGAAPITEALRAESEWAQRGIERRRSQADLASARRLLALQWGAHEATFDSLILDLPSALPDSGRWGGALANQPEMREARAQSAVAAARVRAAKAGRIPELTALAGVRHLAEGSVTGWIASLSAPIPLWNRQESAIAAAEAEQKAAQAHETLVQLELEQRLGEVQDRAEAARTAYDLARNRAEPAAREALTQLESGYRRGRFTYLDILEGRRTLLDIQLAELEAQRDYWAARLELQSWIGLAPGSPTIPEGR